MSKERRGSPRYKANLFIEVSTRSGSSRGVVVDLSTYGFGLETELDLSVGETCDFTIEFPMPIRAQVMSRNAGGHIKRYGMKIVGQSFLDKFIIKKIIKGPRLTK